MEFKSEDEAYNFYNAYAYKTGKYRITDFIAQHTHVTSTPSKSHLHRSQRKLTFVQAAEIDIADSSGIAPKASLELMAKRVGGYENLGFIRDDYKNYLKTKKTIQMKVGETGGVLEYLQSMQLEDPYFFYAIQVDQDDLISNIFWADAKMMIAYSHFGDVVSFDTTYRKNQSGRPFAMFLGVNHHKQTTIFGAALLYDESAETFIWLFDTFVKAMSGKKPKTILTDQDPAMAKALTSQWPETCHRLCIWHLYQNAVKHLSGVFAKFREFAKDFSSCIYDYEEEQEFFLAWNAMLEKYDLKDNDWLIRMFDLRKKWALVYGRETFCADMTTTQWSESMNNVIKNYVSYQHNLLRFFEHFQRLIEDRRYEELKADFKETQMICSCRKFEFTGILCSHALKVLSSKDIKKIPIQYILKRWTKSAKLGNSEFVFANTINEDLKVSLERRYKDLCRLQTQVATKAAETEETYKIARTALAKILDDVDAYLKDNNIGKSISKIVETTTIPSASEKIKGIKNKKRVRGKSTRSRNALERVRKKKNVALGEPSQQQSHASEIADNDVSSNFNSQDLLNLPFNIVPGYHGDQVHAIPQEHQCFGFNDNYIIDNNKNI
nr:protein FAR1-RELATED SEQUENCE 5-like [Ziziphus jujuba var. spinosa]